jgi:hypothetical protein
MTPPVRDSPNLLGKLAPFRPCRSASGCHIAAFAAVSKCSCCVALFAYAAYRGSDGGSNDQNLVKSYRILAFRLWNSFFLTKY